MIPFISLSLLEKSPIEGTFDVCIPYSEIESILKQHRRWSWKKKDSNSDRFLGRAWAQIDSFSAENFMKIVDTSKLLPLRSEARRELDLSPAVNLIGSNLSRRPCRWILFTQPVTSTDSRRPSTHHHRRRRLRSTTRSDRRGEARKASSR